mgnify:FL=1
MNYVQLREMCCITMGQSPNSDSYNEEREGVPFFQGNADFGERYPSVRTWCKEPKKMAKNGDVLISVRAPIGAINYARETCCIGRGLAALSPKTDKVSKEFIFWVMKSRCKELQMKGTGSTFKAISKKILEEVKIPLYPLEKQIEYSLVLEKVYAIIETYKSELQKLDELIQARFVEMFGEPTTNLKGWDEFALSEKLNVVGGYAFKSNQFDEISGIPILRIGNINAGFFKPVNLVYWKEDDNLERYAMYPGDLVMSLTGTVGKDDYGNVCILGNDYEMYYLNQRNAKLEIKEGLDKYYLSHLLKFEQIKKRLTGISRGVRQANISNKDILNLVVPVPPIELQNQFADFVNQVNKSKLVIKNLLQIYKHQIQM